MMLFAMLALAGVASIAPASSPPGAQPPVQAFSDRVARLEARVAQDQSRKLLAPGQDTLLRVQIDAARRAYDLRDPAAFAMLDVIDRQLAQADRTLSQAEDGSGIIVRVGDNVTVALNDGYAWAIANSDPTVLAPKIGVMWARGVQGGFTAKQPGTAILSLTPSAPVPPGTKSPVVFTITVLPR